MARSRSRSRSPKREKRRSRSKSRERTRERRRRGDRHRSRSRSRSPRNRRRSRSRSPHKPRRSRSRSRSPRRRRSPKHKGGASSSGEQKEFNIRDQDLVGKTEEEIEMMKMMGFGDFDSTKGKHVPGSNNAYAVNINRKRKYRQYMNRRGGFNRPLDFIA